MHKKKRKNIDKRKKKNIRKPKYKVTFISLDDPRVHKEVVKRIYQRYLRNLKSESGEEDE